jgi:hypothetical protein
MEEDMELGKEVRRDRLPWCEITDTEKIERLRTVIKQGQEVAGRTYEKQQDIEDTLETHRHGADGMVLVPARNNRGRPTCGSERCPPGKEWF